MPPITLALSRNPAPGTQVIQGILEELAAQPVCFGFEVTSKRNDGGYVIVGLRKLAHKSKPLDESFEGSQAWWPGPPTGAAEVLVVDLESDEIVLAGLPGLGPDQGSKIFLYPPRFLECLLKVWRDPGWERRINQCVSDALAAGYPNGKEANLHRFPMLRDKQAASGQLPKWPASFLWGPPGTGKTTTLGAMVASLLLDNPSYKILLLSTTNSAIDQALIAVDKALEDACDPHAETVRHNCKRIGTQFIAHHYQNRNHLLPQRNNALITRLIDHNRNRPKHDNLAAMARWKEIDSELRQRMREENRKILETSRLAVMTTTRAAFDLEMLRELPTYDLLVIDEASQVSLAHGLAMMPLTRSVLFAGDPMQLSPICQSDTAMAKKWIGRSPFAIYEKVNSQDAKCFLTEQSRMAPAICDLVSDLFYAGDLVVCNKAVGDPIWHAERTVAYADAEGAVLAVPVIEEGRFVPQLDGYARDESARQITEIVRGLLGTGILESDLQILTPFRAQRRLIRRHLREQNLQIIVTTVHRAQGSERKVIIFDPVQGGGTFLNCEEGFRLINVAFSRAKGKLIVLLSQGDARNPKLGPLYNGPVREPLFCELASRTCLPDGLQGTRFGYQGSLYRYTGFRDGRVYVHDGTDTLRKLSLDAMRERCGDPSNCPKGCNPEADPNSRCV